MKKNSTPKFRLMSAAIVSVLLFLLWAGSVLAADSSKNDQAKPGAEYRVPLASEPGKLDPAYITSVYAVNVALNIFDGLVEFDKDLNIVPAIARRWMISRDHRTYTFFLRKGVKFHNGREVIAADFVYSLQRLLDPETQSPVASFFSHILGASEFHEGKSQTVNGLSAPDPYTFKIELREPFAPFISILATVNAAVVPKEAVGPDFGKTPVGTGPFRLHTREPGNRIVLSANKAYFAGPPIIETLNFRIYSNDQWEVIFNDFEKGLLDQAFIPSDKYDEIIATSRYTKNYQFSSTPGLNLVYIGMNQSIPPFDDHRVRQAVSYAVDTETIVREITKRGSVPAKGVLPPGIAGFDPNFKGYAYDVEKARKLLAEAGYPKGENFPPADIWTVSKSENVRKQLEACQKYLAEIGIQIIPRFAKNWKEFIGVINDKKAPMFYAAWYADYPDADNFLYVLFHSRSSTNRMGYKNAEVDKMLEQARRETDYLKRVTMYRKTERTVMNEAPVLCLHINTFNNLLQPWVKGMEIGYLGAPYIPFRKVSIRRR
ncbi:putative ABC transporter, substrate-binding protein [Desulfonema magnum]|uniref:ABC transporter, substrate-binding protein n=2 Tax=Desulfonema magnum TaxID=45655 RepID=A0A975BFD6_9BACT|nr:putative ABC transporter, substrate-binding protein [Desulfonema magnum]